MARLVFMCVVGISGVTGVPGAPRWAPPLWTVAPLGAQAAPTQAAPTRLATLGPGDGIRLRIYREPELNGEYAISDQGTVILPKLGEVKLTGVPADSVRNMLRASYRKFLATDAIEVTPFRRVAVAGAVMKPGLYPVDPSMSVADAVILAGGITPQGRPDVVELRVAGASSGKQLSSAAAVWDTQAGGASQLYVPLQPWVKRNGTLLASMIISGITAIGWFINMAR